MHRSSPRTRARTRRVPGVPPWCELQHDPPRASSRVPRARADDVPALLSSRHTLRCVFHAEWCAPTGMSSQGRRGACNGSSADSILRHSRSCPHVAQVYICNRDERVPGIHGREQRNQEASHAGARVSTRPWSTYMVDIAIMTMDDDDEAATSTAVMTSIVAVRLPVDGIPFDGRSAPCPLFNRQQHNHRRTQHPMPTAGATRVLRASTCRRGSGAYCAGLAPGGSHRWLILLVMSRERERVRKGSGVERAVTQRGQR